VILSPFPIFNVESECICAVGCLSMLLTVSGGSGGSICCVCVVSIGFVDVLLPWCRSVEILFEVCAVSASCACPFGCVGIAWLLSPKCSLWWVPVEDASRCLLRSGRCKCCLCSVGGEAPGLAALGIGVVS
jgi:hypothetical protein